MGVRARAGARAGASPMRTAGAMQTLLALCVGLCMQLTTAQDTWNSSGQYTNSESSATQDSSSTATSSSSTSTADSASSSTTATVQTIFDSSDGMDINGVVLAVGALLVGALLAVAGYRLWQTTVYALGFLGGGIVIAIIFEKVFADKSWVLTASWIAFVVGGVICGYLCVYLYWVGLFIAGAVAGGALAILLNTSFGYTFAPSHPGTVLIVFVCVLGVIGGALAVWLQKPVLVGCTSLVGAFLIIWGVGYFAGDYPTFNDLARFRTYNTDGDLTYDIPGAWWAYLVATLVLFGLSVILQLRFTGKDVDYHSYERRHPRESQSMLPWRRHNAPDSMAPTRVHYGNVATPDVRPQYAQQQPLHQQQPNPQHYNHSQQFYPTSNQVQWDDLERQQPQSSQSRAPAGQPQTYPDTSMVQPEYQQRQHDYQISDVLPTTARPQAEYQVYRGQDPSTPPAHATMATSEAPAARYQGAKGASGTSHLV